MAEDETKTSPSDQLLYKTIGLAVATIGHGSYLAFRYLQHGHVNAVSLGLLVFLTAITLVMALFIVLLKRAEARKRGDDWFVNRG